MVDDKVSIVVPVYNTPEDALRKCIESTINQTYSNIEVLLVDDGSKDLSGDICDEYALKDNRIKVLHKKNGGLSAARNSGYEMATGQWISFLDADDWIEAETCERAVVLAVDNNVDVLIFGTIQELGNSDRIFKYKYNNGTLFTGEECKQLQADLLDFNGNIATAWAKLIRKEFLDRNNIEHNAELRQGSEGIEFNIRLFEHVKRAYFMSDAFYHYVYNPDSISAKHDEKNHYMVVRCFEEIKNQIEVSSNKQMLEPLIYNRFSYTVIAAAITGYFSPVNKVGFFKQRKEYLEYLENPFVKRTVEMAEIDKLDCKRGIILWLIKAHIFLPVRMLAYVRYIQKH